MKNINILNGGTGIIVAIFGLSIGLYYQAFGILLIGLGFIIAAENPFGNKVKKMPLPKGRKILSIFFKISGIALLGYELLKKMILN